MTPHHEVVTLAWKPVACPNCGYWWEPSITAIGERMVLCICDEWLDIYYVRYVIDELGLPA